MQATIEPGVYVTSFPTDHTGHTVAHREAHAPRVSWSKVEAGEDRWKTELNKAFDAWMRYSVRPSKLYDTLVRELADYMMVHDIDKERLRNMLHQMKSETINGECCVDML